MKFREPEMCEMDIAELSRYSSHMDAETICRQLWIAACLDCVDQPWIVFEERYLMARWIESHELDTGHGHLDTWNGLSAV